ncbi:MAG: D-alanyl-D-alanine carboxypeptidase [Thermaerobacter sp.]|nr:D-alanyl-D-alanine carboxypeptidase [Thermaerobacter sp.]
MRRSAILASLALLLASSFAPAAASSPAALGPSAPAQIDVSAPSAVLVEASTGQTIFSKNAQEERPPASMTKLMTLHLALNAVAVHRARMTDPVSVSENAYRLGGSQIWLEPGETIAFGQLLRAIAIGSANDACMAIAEHLAGSEGAFVAQMNAEAKRLGMTRTHYANSHGLDQEGHYTTAADMAKLGRAVVNDPGLLALTSQREDRTIRDGKGGHLWLINHNRLLGKVPGIDGLKTGFTSRAGYCLTATAERQGLRLIAVVMGDATSKQRFADTSALLQSGFSNYEAVLLAKSGQSLGTVKVLRGTQVSVPVVVARDVRAVHPRGEKLKVKLQPKLPTELRAPVRRGQAVGEAQIVAGGKQIAAVPLVANECVHRATWVGLFTGLLRSVVRF